MDRKKPAAEVSACLYCGKDISHRAKSALYCSDSHRVEAGKKRKTYVESEITHGRGEKLTPLRRAAVPLYQRVVAGKASLEDVSLATGEPMSRVTRDYTEWRNAVKEDVKYGDWKQSAKIQRMLGHDLTKPETTDLEACAAWAVEMTRRFMDFEAEFFVVASGRKFLREDFHYEWIEATLATWASGGYLQIMSPPRHGKSELLVHFAVWLICVDPNVRILWVGPSEPIASSMLVAVRTYLEDTGDLIAEVLGPGRSFQPSSSLGRDWSSSSFTVDSRTVTLVGSTMLAVGRGAKILSRNADLIVCDDIEDKTSTAQPKLRQETKDWFGTDLDSRKEEHTGLVVIGSRQHLDDLYGANMEDPNFFSIVNAAHDPSCPKDPFAEDDHQDCMLFPSLRTYRWLMTKKRGATARGNPGLFEMVYQNNPQGEGMASFDEKAVLSSRNPSRSIGIEGIPSGFQLIAGIDPSATGYQAALLWAVRQRSTEVFGDEWGRDGWEDHRLQRWMVDLDNQLGGGIDKALELMQRWFTQYGCRTYVVEINGFQRAIVDDPDVKSWAKSNGVTIIPHRTGMNKIDETYGVVAMNRLYVSGLIDLPYGDDLAKAKTDVFVKQLLTFTEENKRHKPVSDVVMASWFPTERIRRWERKLRGDNRPKNQERRSGYTKSYPRVSSLTRSRNVPWRHR